MGRYIIRRLLWVILVMLMITLFAFLVFYVLPPEDPAVAFAGRQPTEDTIREVREILGLDKPLYMQYLLFVKRLFVGDQFGWPGLGKSFANRVSVKTELFNRALITMQLAIGAAVVWLLIGISIGVVSALRPRSVRDRAAMGFALFGVSAPVFWLGLLSLFIFWEKLHWAPAAEFVPIRQGFFDWFTHLLMPWFVLALLFAAVYARMVRGTMLDTMSEDFIRTARAKGLTERDVIVKHGLRASLMPVVTLFGLDFGGLLGGAVVTESVFNIPGLGQFLIQGANRGDLPVVMGVVVFAGLAITVMNLVVDVVYAYLDPRVRYT